MTERAQAWSNALLAGAFFGLAFGLVNSYLSGRLPPATTQQALGLVAQMLLSGGLFTLIIGLFATSRIVPAATAIPLATGDAVVYSGLANHFLNLEGRGGRLALTRTELVFMPHVVNLQRGELRIPLSEIASVAAVPTWGIIPNGLAVTLKSGKVERFVVNDRSDWVAKLQPGK
jgi:hypothetical protein